MHKKLNKNNYFIKNGYKSGNKNYTLSEKKGDLYWTDERIFLSNFFQYEIYKYARKLIKKNKIKSVIDIGCGVATKLYKLIFPVCNDITGIDQKEAINYCIKNYKFGKFIVMDLENPVKLNKKFDMIICSDVIEHLLNPNKLLKFIYELSNNNTYIIFSTPERDILRGKECNRSEKPEHVREWNKNEIIKYLENNGLKVKYHKLTSFMKKSNNNVVRNIIKVVKDRSGTIKTNQLLVCKLN